MGRYLSMALVIAFWGASALGETVIALPEGWAKAVAIAPDGKALAVATIGGVYLFDLARLVSHSGQVGLDEAEPVVRFPLEGYVHAVDISPDGRYLAAGGWSRTRIWDLKTGELHAELVITGFVYALAFAPMGELLLGLSTGDVALWTPGSEELIWRKRLHGGAVWGVAASPDGMYGASGGAGEGLLFRLVDGEVLFTFPGHAWDVEFTPDGFLLGIGAGKVFEIYDTATGFLYFSAQKHHGCIWGVAFSADGVYAATASLDGTVRLWNVEEGVDLLALGEGEGSMEDVALGGGYLVACRRDGRVYIWRLAAILGGDAD